MTLIQIIHAQNEMIRLKGTAGYEEQKKIVKESKEKSHTANVTLE